MINSEELAMLDKDINLFNDIFNNYEHNVRKHPFMGEVLVKVALERSDSMVYYTMWFKSEPPMPMRLGKYDINYGHELETLQHIIYQYLVGELF